MVLAATAIPIELRLPTYEASGFSVSANLVTDVLANIIGYVPVGIVLWDRGPLRAVTTAAGIAIFAETAQFVMAHRDPSILDVSLKHCGRNARRGDRLPLEDSSTRICGEPSEISNRGADGRDDHCGHVDDIGRPAQCSRGDLPGRLEAHWKLDEESGRIAQDSSGHGLDGKLSKEPNRVDGEPSCSTVQQTASILDVRQRFALSAA